MVVNSSLKVYIAGRISGNDNYKAQFAQAEKKLQEAGYIKIVNPTCLPNYLDYNDYANICLAMVDSCDIIYAMSNSEFSLGAQTEINYARWKGKVIISDNDLIQ